MADRFYLPWAWPMHGTIAEYGERLMHNISVSQQELGMDGTYDCVGLRLYTLGPYPILAVTLRWTPPGFHHWKQRLRRFLWTTVLSVGCVLLSVFLAALIIFIAIILSVGGHV
jgi:hypothetical protein